MSRSRRPRSRTAETELRAAAASPAAAAPSALDEAPPYAAPARTELFVWFEDNRQRGIDGWRGSAGFPECLLPCGKHLHVIDRRYAEGHVHLLAAARIRCDERLAECVATIYTSALALGTIAWIGTGEQYRRAWTQMYPRPVRSLRTRRENPAV